MISLFRDNFPEFKEFYPKIKKIKEFEKALLNWIFGQFFNPVREQDRDETVQK